MVEQLNRTLKSWISGLQSEAKFRDHVRQCLAHSRATPHCTTGMSPIVVPHGRLMQLELSWMALSGLNCPVKQRLTQRMKGQQELNQRHYDKRHSVKMPVFRMGLHSGKAPGSHPQDDTLLLYPSASRKAGGTVVLPPCWGINSERRSPRSTTCPGEAHHFGRPMDASVWPVSPNTQAKDPGSSEASSHQVPKLQAQESSRKDRELPPMSSEHRRWQPDRLIRS